MRADVGAMTARLLAALHRHGIPAVGFVNEGKLAGAEDARTPLLRAWLDAGHELGNHTYSHLRLFDASTAEFEADVIRGEAITRPLMAARGKALRYFRHPTLNTGRDAPAKAAAESVLDRYGYTVAPVTVDSDEYLYAAAYQRAHERGDAPLTDRLGEDYVRYMSGAFDYYEGLAESLIGRDIAHTLLLHANWLNADYVPQLATMLASRGYRFVALDEALNDPAYDLSDRFIGPRGPSWLERWALTQGYKVEGLTPVPAWVIAAGR
jgi:peptidoglycan/xylan/chitin deacetylase (PgdA/CDA1 family)